MIEVNYGEDFPIVTGNESDGFYYSFCGNKYGPFNSFDLAAFAHEEHLRLLS